MFLDIRHMMHICCKECQILLDLDRRDQPREERNWHRSRKVAFAHNDKKNSDNANADLGLERGLVVKTACCFYGIHVRQLQSI